MLTAAIVAAAGSRVVCLRAYAHGRTAAPCRWVGGQMRRDRGPRHLVAMDAPPALRIAAITVAATAMTFAAAACSSSSPSTQDSGSHSYTTAELVEFSECMRAHGVKNFPDPVNGAFSFSGVGPHSVDPSSSAFQAAKAACSARLPGGGQTPAVTAQELAAGDKLAVCMRAHGFPGFPDPTSQNTFDLPTSINTNLPAYQAAFNTCQSQAHDNNAGFQGAAKSGQGS
jgi:hypothetical protein